MCGSKSQSHNGKSFLSIHLWKLETQAIVVISIHAFGTILAKDEEIYDSATTKQDSCEEVYQEDSIQSRFSKASDATDTVEALV